MAQNNARGINIPSNTIPITGEVDGYIGNATIIKLQGNAVSSATPTDGYVLGWSGTNNDWESKIAQTRYVLKNKPMIKGLTSVSDPFNVRNNHAILINSTGGVVNISFVGPFNVGQVFYFVNATTGSSFNFRTAAGNGNLGDICFINGNTYDNVTAYGILVYTGIVGGFENFLSI